VEYKIGKDIVIVFIDFTKICDRIRMENVCLILDRKNEADV
jgi:hypothetical protein